MCSLCCMTCAHCYEIYAGIFPGIILTVILHNLPATHTPLRCPAPSLKVKITGKSMPMVGTPMI